MPKHQDRVQVTKARFVLSKAVATIAADHGLSMGEVSQIAAEVAAEYARYATETEELMGNAIKQLEHTIDDPAK